MKPQSMEEKISSRLVLIGLTSLLLTAALTIFVFHRSFNQKITQDIAQSAEVLATAYEYLPNEQALENFCSESLRITLISPTGDVLFESASNAAMENHLSRPEVRQALEDGTGYVQRTSDTMGYNTTYYARLLADGNILRLAQDTENLYSIYDEALPAAVVCCVLVLLLSTVLSILLTRQLVRPIEQMAGHLDTIDENVPYKELAPFAQSIRCDRLLRENNERVRQEFTANVSHELKTPLTSISGYAELLTSGAVEPKDIPCFAGRIHNEADRMIRLVGDIIKLTELDGKEALTAAPEFAPVELSKLAHRCAERLSLNAKKAYVSLEQSCDSVTVRGNETLLEELCYNLCDNAIRYNRPGGKVVVSTGRLHDGHAFLTVKDNGIGIPRDAQDRVFERFYRVDKSRSKATGGTGLGLAIVKHVSLLHGAKLQLDSQVGTGTKITVLFPD